MNMVIEHISAVSVLERDPKTWVLVPTSPGTQCVTEPVVLIPGSQVHQL